MADYHMEGDTSRKLDTILAADERHPSIGRQVANGLGGVMVLLITGIAIVLLVLWKSP